MEYLPEARSDGSYINESERNVHVWCSSIKRSSYAQFSGKATLGLIAGDLAFMLIYCYSVSLSSRVLCTQWVAPDFSPL